MLSDYMLEKDIATIANRLQVPLIVADILNGEEDLSKDVTYGLHEILSDDQPDSALLSIALSAYSLANTFQGHAATFRMLKMECERIIAEYGMMWLRNAQAKTLDNNTVFETLVHIPEDLECLAELLEFAKITLNHDNSEAADVCTILITQANAQSLIAETYLEHFDLCDENPWDMDPETENDMNSVIADQALQTVYADNVIQFPGSQN